jgi:hypothetical protein
VPFRNSMRLPLVAVLGLLLRVTKAEDAFEYEPADLSITEALVKNGVNLSVLPNPAQVGVAAVVRGSFNRHALSAVLTSFPKRALRYKT